MVTTNTLVQVATVGGVLTAGIGFKLLDIMVDKVRSSQYYIEALRLLRENQNAIELLGEPIKDFKFNRSDETNFCDGKRAHFQVPVVGPKCAGTYFFWADWNEDKWTISRAELARRADLTKRILIVNNPSTTDVSVETVS